MNDNEILAQYIATEFKDYPENLSVNDIELIRNSYGFARYIAFKRLDILISEIKKTMFFWK